MRLILMLLTLATPAFADTPLSGAEFDALVTGKTLTFSAGGDPYGIEYYAPNRRVIWSFGDGECQSGNWFEKPSDSGPQICFVYENRETPQCWQVFKEGDGLRAQFMGRPDTTVLYQAKQADPLVCGGTGA